MKRKSPATFVTNPRVQLIVIALSLLLTTSVLGLSAYLTSYDDTQSTFILATGSQFGITISGTEYNDRIVVPGEELPLSPVVANKSDIPVFLFAELTKPDIFTWTGINTGEWTLMSEESDGTQVYYYGSGGTLSEFTSDSELLSGIVVNDMDELPDEAVTCSVSVRCYAVQIQGHSATNLQETWQAALSAPGA